MDAVGALSRRTETNDGLELDERRFGGALLSLGDSLVNTIEVAKNSEKISPSPYSRVRGIHDVPRAGQYG